MGQAVLLSRAASWRAGPWPGSACHVGLKRHELLPISAIIRKNLLTCGTVLCTDQTLWISVEHQSRIMCSHMCACARMCAYAFGTCQSSSETAKIRKWENMKVRKDGKNLIGLVISSDILDWLFIVNGMPQGFLFEILPSCSSCLNPSTILEIRTQSSDYWVVRLQHQ